MDARTAHGRPCARANESALRLPSKLDTLAILSVALLHLFLFDVWRLDTLYRIVSFLVLGVVLLILSFVYSRFAETFRRWRTTT